MEKKAYYRVLTPAVFILFVSLTLKLSDGEATDRTMEDKAYGLEVVSAVARKIGRSQLFSDDYEFLRRVAFMESKYGENLNDQSDNFKGGIWQLKESDFQKTKSEKLKVFHAGILKELQIDWNIVSYSDLLKPLYSGLAARLHMQSITPSIPQTVGKQAWLWHGFYSKNPLRPRSDYVDQITFLENNTATCNGLFDLTVVLDGSGSVGLQDFQKSKDFVIKLFESFSSDAVRKSFILFGFDAYMIFPLNSNYNSQQIRNIISKVNYPAEATNTNAGILMAVNMILSSNMKPGVPSILIVFTDGESNVGNGVSNIKYAKQANITTFAIGIGARLKVSELLEITYNDASHVMIVHDFNTLATLTNRLNAEACLVSQKPEIGEAVTDKLTKNENRYYTYPLTKNGVTVIVNGSVDGYYSFTEENPSKSINDGVLDQTETFIRWPNGTSTSSGKGTGNNLDPKLHIGIYGKEKNNSYTITGYEGFGKPPEKNKTGTITEDGGTDSENENGIGEGGNGNLLNKNNNFNSTAGNGDKSGSNSPTDLTSNNTVGLSLGSSNSSNLNATGSSKDNTTNTATETTGNGNPGGINSSGNSNSNGTGTLQEQGNANAGVGTPTGLSTSRNTTDKTSSGSAGNNGTGDGDPSENGETNDTSKNTNFGSGEDAGDWNSTNSQNTTQKKMGTKNTSTKLTTGGGSESGSSSNGEDSDFWEPGEEETTADKNQNANTNTDKNKQFNKDGGQGNNGAGSGGSGNSGSDFNRLPQSNPTSTGQSFGVQLSQEKCMDNLVYFLPFPGSCDKYTLCACGGVKILLECAPGLYFDPIMSKCNFIQLVDCPDSPFANFMKKPKS